MTLTIDFSKVLGVQKWTLSATFDQPITAIMGPSDAGKTTLFKCICGLLPVDNGTIVFNGVNWENVPTEQRRIGYLPQDLALFPNLTVAGNLGFGLSVSHVDRLTISQKVTEIANYLNIEHLLNRQISALSGGEKQRVAMGRALIVNPALLLFDEPFNGLDEATRQACLELVNKIVADKNIQLLLITHHQQEADALTKTVYIVENGMLKLS